jgi:hypothetical protein
MKTYYQIVLGKRFSGIKTVQVESETACTVTINNRLQNKISSRFCYYSNLEEAKNALRNYFSREAKQAEFNIMEQKKLLERFKKYISVLENYQI